MTAPPALSLPRGILHGREVECIQCPHPCARQLDAAHYGDPCAACPLPAPRWGAFGLCGESAPAPAGDRLADWIARTVLDPLRPHAPVTVAAVENCGGCAHARRALGSVKAQPPETIV